MPRRLPVSGLFAALILVAVASTARAQPPGEYLERSWSQWLADLNHREGPVRRSAAFVLGKMGNPGALAALAETLEKDQDPTVRAACAFAMGEIGVHRGDPVPQLVQFLVAVMKDPDPRVRRSAAYALGKYGVWASPAGPVLQAALRDPEPMVRQNAAWALGQLDEGARKAAVGPLVKLLRDDKDPQVRRDAALALGKAGGDAHAAVPVLVERFREDKDQVVRKTALNALADVVTSRDGDVAAALRGALKDPDPDNVRSAAFALANIGGKESADALPVLRRALHDKDVADRRLAATALANLARNVSEALPDLTEALADPDAQVRRSAALGLGNMGEKARAATPALIKALDPSEDEEVRKFAAEALGNIDPNDPEVLAALLKVLGEKGHYSVRHRVVWALERLKEFEQPGVVKGLADTLQEEEPEGKLLRYEAAKALAIELHERVPDKVIDVLYDALKNDKIKVYRGTGAKVSGAGTEARTGQAELQATGEGDWRTIVAYALGMIGKRAKRPEILDGLKKLSEESSDPKTREVAKKALRVLERE